MSSRNVLVVVLDAVPDDEVRTAVRARAEAGDVSVRVVAPAAEVGVLQWLTGAEDDARSEAEELASRTADALEAEVETEVGDRDPVVAVQDALVEFAADEIVVVGRASRETEAAIRRFDLPVSTLQPVPGPSVGESGEGGLAREVARGGAPRTLLLLLGVVAGFLLCAIVLLSLITFLVFWLVQALAQRRRSSSATRRLGATIR